MRIETLIEEALIGKIFVDSKFSSKGDHEYYDNIGVNYPGFDGVITEIKFLTDSDGDFILGIHTTTGYIEVYETDDIILKEVNSHEQVCNE